MCCTRRFLTCGVLAHGFARVRCEQCAFERLVPFSCKGRGFCPSCGRYWTWAALMRRAFDLDVLLCPRCAGQMQLIATIEDPAVIQRILAHLGLPGARGGPPPPWSMTAAGAEQPPLPGVTI